MANNNTSTSINGSRFSHVDLSISFGNLNAGNQAFQTAGGDLPRGIVKSLSYDAMLDAGLVQGNQVAIVGRTQGYGTATGNLEIYAAEFDQFASILTGNNAFPFMTIDFDLTASFSINDIDVRTDRLIGVRITKVGTSSSSGNDALSKTLDLSIARVIMNGIDMYGDPNNQ